MPVPIKRVNLIILDSVGCGDAPDAAAYGDEGSHTLANIARAVGGLNLPHLGAFGLGTRATFADTAATIADLLGLAWPGAGQSFARELLH